MAEYRGIEGAAVQSLANNTGTIQGQIWYDNATTAFKLETVTASATWASGTSLPGPRDYGGQAGLQTAAIFAGGTPGAPNTSFTYNGSTWTATNNLGTGTSIGCMMGTQTLAVMAGTSRSSSPYSGSTATEEWDGTNWTNGGALNTARYGVFSGGTQTAAVIAGGSGPATYFDDTEEYNGSSWTSVTNMPGNTGNGTSGADLQTDMYCVGGGPGNKTTSLVYDGTNWTTGVSLSGAGRRGCGGAMATSSGLGFVAGGETATVNPITTTEEWNGTSFSSSTAIPTATRDPAKGDGGTGAAGLFSGGTTSGVTSNVFEFTGGGVAETRTITTS